MLQTIKTVLGSLGMITGGAVIYLGPQGMADEIPLHEPIGLVLIAFGVLFLTTLWSVRAKALTIFLAAAAISGALGYAAWQSGGIAWRLSQFGTPAIATVESSTTVPAGRLRVPRRTIRFAGRRSVVHRAVLQGAGKRGKQVSILYLPDDPKIVAEGQPGDGFFDLLQRGAGVASFAALAGFSLLIGLFAIFSFFGFVFGEDLAATEDNRPGDADEHSDPETIPRV